MSLTAWHGTSRARAEGVSEEEGGGKCSEITFSMPTPAQGMEPGSGLLAGTVWALSAPLGTASHLEVLSTWQDQASKGSCKGATEQQSTHAHTRVPVLTSMLAQLHAGRMALASLVSLSTCRPCWADARALPCPHTSCIHLLSAPAHCITVVNASAGSRCQCWVGLELVLSALSIPDPILPTATSKSKLCQLSLGRRGQCIRRKSPVNDELTAPLSEMLFILSQKGVI